MSLTVVPPATAAATPAATAATTATSALAPLMRKIRSREARVGIIGLGYVGLPLAVEFARAGFRVTGFEVDAERAARINRGDSYIPDVPQSELGEQLQAQRLNATTDWSELANMDAIS